jgi:hypothetical protein
MSSGRAMVTEATINEFKNDVVDPMLAEPESEGLTLNDVGNGDEWWFDINKLLLSKTVGVRGEEHRQEVPSERSPHITVFSGAAGFESSAAERAAERAKAAECRRVARELGTKEQHSRQTAPSALALFFTGCHKCSEVGGYVW